MKVPVLLLADLNTIYGKGVYEALKKVDNVEVYHQGAFEKAPAEASVLVVTPFGDMTQLHSLFEKHNIKWMHSWYAGVDHLYPFITEKLLSHPVVVTNAKGAYSNMLAEWVATTCGYFEKDIPRVACNMKKKKWEKFTMGHMRGKTIGFVGFGDIAQQAAKLMKAAFGMTVLALRNDPSKESPGADEVFGADDSSKIELFRKSDYVVCSLPKTPKTTNFCDSTCFVAMKPTAVFVSIGRGSAVNEDHLHEVLLARTIKGAALDVFREEPLPETSKLWDLPNVLITSHNADISALDYELARDVFVKNLSCFNRGASSPSGYATPIDKQRGY
eukprot:GHVU01022957.1.p1 GENE.GHVU01022957.1~~GHVU01022957.1.p1  ORF type:complete len:330 (+),score=54.19 GHVU01022957.1:160-1149(+)